MWGMTDQMIGWRGDPKSDGATVRREGIVLTASMAPDTTMEDLAEALRALAAGLGFLPDTIANYFRVD